MIEYNKKLVIDWFRKSQDESKSDIFSKFIFLWIAFNWYYFSISQETRDEDSLIDLVNEKTNINKWKKCLEEDKDFSNFFKYIKYKKDWKINNLKDNSKNVIWNDKDDFKQYLKVIYQIRCNLFHWWKDLYSKNDEKLITYSFKTLNSLFEKLIMKTILVDAWNTFVTESWINKEMQELLDWFPNKKIILTNANEEEKKKLSIINMPYEVFSLNHNPDKTWDWFYEKMLKHFSLKKEDVVYFEHNKDAVEKAEIAWIDTFWYDKDKKDLKDLKIFLENNI